MVGFALRSGVAPGLALTLAEREVISRGVTAHRSARSIAKLLGRSPSTVSREMSRNGGYDRYRATLADENAWARSRRPKCCKLAIAHLNKVARQLNERPRETLQFETPAERFNACVASIG
jgi:IS30 family transposase